MIANVGHAEVLARDPATVEVILRVVGGPHRGKEFAYRHHDAFLVGRAPDCNFHLSQRDMHFSRHHFLVEANPPLCQIQDLGSRNGTFVNGKRIEKALLHDGDEITGGLTVIKVVIRPGADAGDISIPTPPTSPASRLPLLALPPPTYGVATDTGDERRSAPSLPGIEIVRELGRGGMGVVYLARRTLDDGLVALKTIVPQVTPHSVEVERFLREAAILQQLDHPRIIRFHDMGKMERILYFVMEYVPAPNAFQVLQKQKRPLAVARAVGWICDLLEALEHAHSKGFVHRDIKPGNLLVLNQEGRETIKLLDFGLARVYQASPMSGISLEGMVGGTLPFMPPEQITDFRASKPPADQYSAAATLYTLLTGKFLFDLEKANQQCQLRMILQDEPTPIRTRRRDIPEKLGNVIHRALQKAPERRFSCATAFRTALASFVND